MAVGTVPAKAERLAERLPTLSRGRSKATGQEFFVIPASNRMTAHWTAVDGSGCTCRSYQYRGRCAHATAAAIYYQRLGLASEAETDLAFAEVGTRLRGDDAGSAVSFGPCTAKGCTNPAGGKSRLCGPCLDKLIAELGA